MTIHETIKEQIKDAMRAKDVLKLEVLRGLQALFSNDLIAQGSNDLLVTDDTAITIIKRAVKQRKDSIDQFEKGGRSDLADKERAELDILSVFLPQTLSREEIKKIVLSKFKEMSGPIDIKKSGQFVGTIMKDLKGTADGSDVKAVVEEVINELQSKLQSS